MERGMPLNKS